MRNWVNVASVLILVAVMSCFVAVSCKGSDSESDAGKGRITGVITDAKEHLTEGTSPQTYEGSLIQVYEAVEAGRYRLAEGEPEQIDYETGELVTEVESGEGGRWEVSLEPGKYFIRAFYGDTSYSDEILTEVEPGEIKKLDLELVHGV